MANSKKTVKKIKEKAEWIDNSFIENHPNAKIAQANHVIERFENTALLIKGVCWIIGSLGALAILAYTLMYYYAQN